MSPKSKFTPTKSTLIPAVGYLRCSTDKQETSIADQCEAIKQYAEDKGYRIVRWYTDEGISGDDTKKRKDFLKMTADAVNVRDFKAILCWDEARFGRFDSIEYGYQVYPLREAGVYLATVIEGIVDWNESSGRMMGTIKQEGKHQQLLDLSANVARGQLEAVKNGSWVGSIPYAYRLEGPKKNKRLVVDDPGKVRIVQRIFREYVEEGRSMHNIAERLNDEGVISPGGRAKGWRWDSVKVILENPAYAGDFAGLRWSYGKYHRIRNGRVEKSNGRTRNPESEWVIHRDHHEAIIDRATFENAKAILAKVERKVSSKDGKERTIRKGRNPRYAPEDNPYILSCLLRCGRCGCPLYAMTKQGKHYYECGNRHYNGNDSCQGTTVREDVVLRSIADNLHQEYLSLDGEAVFQKLTIPDHLIMEMRLSPDDAEAVLQKWEESREQLTPDDLPEAFARIKALVAPPVAPAADRRRLEKQAEQLKAQAAKARANIVLLDADLIPDAQDRIRKIEGELAAVEKELRERKQPAEKDVNAIALEVLDALVFMSLHFRALSEGFHDYQPQCRKGLRGIAGITVHTTIQGRGNGIRHAFERGEIAFKQVPLNASNLNPHRPGKSRKCCR